MDAFYLRRFTSDTETQAVRGKREGTNCDARLGDNRQGMVGQWYSETFPSRYWNTQRPVLYFETVAGDELWFDGVRGLGRVASTDRLFPSRKYSCCSAYSAELVVAG